MPTYEYRCPQDHTFEVFQRMSDPPQARCPHCGAEAERMLSAGAGVIFKGSGFYITDYRSDSYKKAATSEGTAAGGAEVKESSGGAKKADAPAAEKGTASSPTTQKPKDSKE